MGEKDSKSEIRVEAKGSYGVTAIVTREIVTPVAVTVTREVVSPVAIKFGEGGSSILGLIFLPFTHLYKLLTKKSESALRNYDEKLKNSEEKYKKRFEIKIDVDENKTRFTPDDISAMVAPIRDIINADMSKKDFLEMLQNELDDEW